MRSSISFTFQKPGVADAELERNARETILKLLYAASGDAPRLAAAGADVGMVPKDGGFLTGLPIPSTLPSWITSIDIDFYTNEFARTGFRGGLNWYRNIDRNWGLMAPFAGAKVMVPSLYVTGDRDLVAGFRGMNKLIANLRELFRNCTAQSCCRVAVTGPSRSARQRLIPP